MLSLVPPSVANDDGSPFAPGHAARTLEALRRHELIPAITPELEKAIAAHPVAVTPVLLDLIDPEDPADPVARQFIPSPLEVDDDPAAIADPLGDKPHSPLAGVVHRYPDRLLLNLVMACPAYCRFCFRRQRVGKDGGVLSPEETEKALDYIRAHDEVWEVIFSGGEPLILSDRRLREVLMELRAIAHVRSLRIHTRAPITTPERITPELVRLLSACRKPVSMLLHCNHPRELGPAARAAIGRLADAGVALYSQSVLLRGVNADHETLESLMRTFVECRIKPHYLHHPDLARGTKHFRLPLEEGIALVKALRGRVSGLCQPQYILEIPGGNGKVRVLSDSVQKVEGGWRLTNERGESFFYEG